jgi:hypothetical protein
MTSCKVRAISLQSSPSKTMKFRRRKRAKPSQHPLRDQVFEASFICRDTDMQVRGLRLLAAYQVSPAALHCFHMDLAPMLQFRPACNPSMFFFDRTSDFHDCTRFKLFVCSKTAPTGKSWANPTPPCNTESLPTPSPTMIPTTRLEHSETTTTQPPNHGNLHSSEPQ